MTNIILHVQVLTYAAAADNDDNDRRCIIAIAHRFAEKYVKHDLIQISSEESSTEATCQKVCLGHNEIHIFTTSVVLSKFI